MEVKMQPNAKVINQWYVQPEGLVSIIVFNYDHNNTVQNHYTNFYPELKMFNRENYTPHIGTWKVTLKNK